MKWSRRSAHSIVSGGYIISRVWQYGALMYCVYHGEEWLGFHDSKEQAKKAAADHKGAA